MGRLMKMAGFELDAPLMQAGLAGYSDRAMRLVARRRGCPYAVTEAMLDRTLLLGGKGLQNSIDVNGEDHPVAGQLMGSDPHEMADAGAILVEHGYDVIDLNFACPVKKVKNKARGGWMLQDTDRGTAILRAVRDELPDQALSLSTRRGFDDTPESEDRFWHLCEAARELGYAALRVHGRTVEQKYAGRSKRPFLAGVKQAFPDWTIWGSGDVFDPYDIVDMLRETGVDGAWVARGAIGNPWIFRDAIKLLRDPDDPIPPPTRLRSSAARWRSTSARPSRSTASPWRAGGCARSASSTPASTRGRPRSKSGSSPCATWRRGGRFWRTFIMPTPPACGRRASRPTRSTTAGRRRANRRRPRRERAVFRRAAARRGAGPA